MNELTTSDEIRSVVGERFFIAGNSWAHLGVHGDKDIWVSVQEGNRSAYVVICDLHDPKKRWRVTKREWVRPHPAEPVIGKVAIENELAKLKVEKISWHRTLRAAQQSIALLTRPLKTPQKPRRRKVRR